jgi:hypothetical protein
VSDFLQVLVENPLPTLLVLIGIVLLFAIVNSPQGEWVQIGRKLALVIGGLILLAIIFGLVMSRTIS